MEHISVLQGFGKGKKCLIVGGGLSVRDFRFDLINGIYVICLNNHMSQLANMIIYSDTEMKKYFEKHVIGDDTVLVGYKYIKPNGSEIDRTCERVNYYYGHQDIDFGDTGYHALQIVDRVFNFNKIYLTGYDYYIGDKTYHHDEDISDFNKIKKFIKHSIGIGLKSNSVLDKYSGLKLKNKVYNCNKKSAIKCFSYGVPYKKTKET